MRLWLENIGRLLGLLILQLLLINNLHFMGICNPCFYILFLIALPANLPHWAEQLIAFVTGALMDLAANTPGVHAAACVAIGFARPKILHNIVPDDDRLIGTISTRTLDWPAYARLVLGMTLIHHAILFMLLNFTFHALWLTLLQIVVSAAVTILLILGRELMRN